MRDKINYFKTGDKIYGFCHGYFGRGDYETKICVMSTDNYAVFQYTEGELKGSATVLNYPNRLNKEMIDGWKKPEFNYRVTKQD